MEPGAGAPTPLEEMGLVGSVPGKGGTPRQPQGTLSDRRAGKSLQEMDTHYQG